jgi:hypothetical protein
MLSTFEPHAQVLPEAMPVEDRTRSTTVRGARLVVFFIGLFCLLGIALSLWLRTIPAGNPDPHLAFNVFYCLFARNEPAGLLVVVGFALFSAFFVLRRTEQTNAAEPVFPVWLCPAVALLVFIVTAVGTDLVFHNYLVTADENLADFQARIFLRGRIQAEVATRWLPALRIIKPTFVDYFPATHSWKAAYLPVYAAMRAVFQSVGLQSIFNPFLAAITIFALYATVRNIWPESKTNAVIAIGILASSSQFLLMSMTGYSMPAHLALNTIWLWLYSRPDRRMFYVAPLVGALAIGLHEPIVHALFVLPFLLRLVWQRRWTHVVFFGTVYLAACICWYKWKFHYMPPSAPNGHGASIFRLANPRMAIIQPMNLLLVIGWASLATPLLAVFGLSRFRKANPMVQDSVASCILTFAFYYFFYLDQAHGWGYRYFYGALSCLVIVAVAGFSKFAETTGFTIALRFALVGITASLFVQLPLRCIQAEQFVRPFARSASVIHAMPTDFVALDARDAWYSADLIRNDPFLENRPVVVSIFGLTPAAIDVLSKAGTVHFLTRDELTRLGMFTRLRNDYGHDPFQLGRGK